MTDRNKGKAPSQRQLKVGETIRHALAEIFARGEIVDEVLDQYSLTVSEVRMTPDLKLATAFVLPLGGEGAEDAVQHLDKHKRFLRRARQAREPEIHARDQIQDRHLLCQLETHR